MTNQREVILDALMDIIENEKYNNIVLQETLTEHDDMESHEKAFITQCVNGTLRNMINIDYVINFYSNTKTKKMRPLILNLLRISVYQIKFMDRVPDSAIVNEAVNIAKKRGLTKLSGFVNAILRNVIRNTPEIKYPDKNKNIDDYISVVYSIPKWIIHYWSKELTYEQIEMTAENQMGIPQVNICINSSKTNKEELTDILEKEEMEVEDGKLLENSLRLKKTSNIVKKDSFQKGLYHVMDESSMICVNVLDLKEKDVVIDLCAAPGGKSLYISDKMNGTGDIFAFDIHKHKIKLIRDSVKRLGTKNIKPLLNDATEFNEKLNEIADILLIDAPCSGLGMIQKKPDIKINKSLDDIKEVVKLQREILENSYKYVKIGGTLVYSTCTISKLENIDNIKWFLEKHDFELESIEEFLPESMQGNTGKEGYIALLPYEYDTDGFFIAKLRRKG